jgi:hypothetical protein
MEPYITTYTGKKVNPLALKVSDISIDDIAHGLALCNRFAGHSKRPISVAHHSVYVCRLCDEDPVAEFQALLHDASEAYLGDVTRWLKATPEMEAYRAAEKRAMDVIFTAFKLPTKQHVLVDAADRLMVRYELRHVKKYVFDHPEFGRCTKEEEERIGPWAFWTWQRAKEVFMAHYWQCLTRVAVAVPANKRHPWHTTLLGPRSR